MKNVIQGTVHSFANANNDLQLLDLDLKKNQEILIESRYPTGWSSDKVKETLYKNGLEEKDNTKALRDENDLNTIKNFNKN